MYSYMGTHFNYEYLKAHQHYCCYYCIITIIIVLQTNIIWNTCILSFAKYLLKYYLYDLY